VNKATRKALDEVIGMLNAIDIDGIEQILTDIQAEEQDKFDNLSEGLQAADRGLAIEEAANSLMSAIDNVADVRSAIEEAIGSIESAQE
jgi:hypothetical protein